MEQSPVSLVLEDRARPLLGTIIPMLAFVNGLLPSLPRLGCPSIRTHTKKQIGSTKQHASSFATFLMQHDDTIAGIPKCKVHDLQPKGPSVRPEPYVSGTG